MILWQLLIKSVPGDSLYNLFCFLLRLLISPGNSDAADLGMESAVLYPLSCVPKLPMTMIIFQVLHGRRSLYSILQ